MKTKHILKSTLIALTVGILILGSSMAMTFWLDDPETLYVDTYAWIVGLIVCMMEIMIAATFIFKVYHERED